MLRRRRNAPGLYYTCINSFLTAEETAYILSNSQSQILITSESRRAVAAAAVRECAGIKLCLVVDGASGLAQVVNLDEAAADFPGVPIPDETLGGAMLYSSGTTGRPKGILRPLPPQPPAQLTPFDELPEQSVALSRGPRLSFASAPLPCRASCRGRSHNPVWRNRHHYGALRGGAISERGRDLSRFA